MLGALGVGAAVSGSALALLDALGALLGGAATGAFARRLAAAAARNAADEVLSLAASAATFSRAAHGAIAMHAAVHTGAADVVEALLARDLVESGPDCISPDDDGARTTAASAWPARAPPHARASLTTPPPLPSRATQWPRPRRSSQRRARRGASSSCCSSWQRRAPRRWRPAVAAAAAAATAAATRT